MKKNGSKKKRKSAGAAPWIALLIVIILGSLTLAIVHAMKSGEAIDWQKDVTETIDRNNKAAISGLITEGPDARVTRNNIVIAGEAADSLIISLKVNGIVTAVMLPEQGAFAFKDIELQPGENEIMVYAMDIQGNVTLLQKLTTDYGSRKLDYMARNIIRGNKSRKQIALTFDGGSGNGATNEILDILKEKGITCTMFLTGRFIRRFKDETRRIVDEGHEVGNHTWSHPHLTTFAENRRHDTAPGITRKMLQHELVATAKQFKKITGQKMAPFWRAPFGEHNRQIRLWAAEIGYTQIGWTAGRDGNMDSMDWIADTTSAIYKSSQQVLHDLLHFGDSTDVKANGGIILMHLDTQRQTDPVHRILPAFIDSMQTRGYEFVTISQLLSPAQKENITSTR